ncbi:MAG: DUF952 domain-containing protein [Roseiflexaceae bacterium]|nr:DUF952 domain-containing protein [Roseiflexaceae bacterium]
MTTIYHLVSQERWRSWPADADYLPAEYTQDGFVHCTAGDELMLQVANRFYRGVPGQFLLLVLDAEQLTSPLVWERPADELAPLFPHIYGPINRAAIIGERTLLRDASGDFTAIA